MSRPDLDRSRINRALAKALAYAECGKPAAASSWAAELCRLLGSHDILTEEAKELEPLERSGAR